MHNADWSKAFRAATAGTDRRSAEQAARSLLEAAPGPVRWLLSIGWRHLLGLRLDRAGSTSHIAGWLITDVTPEEIVLEARSRLLTAVKTVRRSRSHLTVITAVHYENVWGRIMWLAVLPVHLLAEPFLLACATKRFSRPTPR